MRYGKCPADIAALALAAIAILDVSSSTHAAGGGVQHAIVGEPNQQTQEVSTLDVRSILVDGSAILIDTRTRAEYDAGHIPHAHNFTGSPSDTVTAIAKFVGGDRSAALVLYCNGPFCQASRRLGEGLVAAGFVNVRRYQLGMPIWRALGGPTAIELDGLLRVYRGDRTAVFLDARSADEFAQGTLPGAHSVPVDRLASGGLKNAPLPQDDFNTRIVLFGRDEVQARALAEALSNRPWHNVSYFSGTFGELRSALK